MQQSSYADGSFDDGFNLGFAEGYHEMKAEYEQRVPLAVDPKIDRIHDSMNVLVSNLTNLEDRMVLRVQQSIPGELDNAKADLDHVKALLAATRHFLDGVTGIHTVINSQK